MLMYRTSAIFEKSDFPLAQHRSEGFSAAFEESDRQFSSLALFVFPAGHLSCFLRLTDFFFAFGTFSHEFRSRELLCDVFRKNLSCMSFSTLTYGFSARATR